MNAAEPLLPTQAADAALVRGPRLREGLDADALPRPFAFASIVDWRKVDRLVETGHLSRDGARIAATARGRLLLDAILGEIAVAEPKASAASVERPESSEPPARPAPPLVPASAYYSRP